MTHSKGQVVVMLLLVMVVVLTIGLSIAARSTTDVNISTLNEQSARAFSAAEAGLEDALKNPDVITATPREGAVGSAKFSVRQVGQASTIFAFPGGVVRDDPAQVWLSNYPSLTDTGLSGKTIVLYWDRDSAPLNCVAEPKTAALEYSYIYESAGTYYASHGFYDPCGPSRPDVSGFTTAESGAYERTTNIGVQRFKYRTAAITLAGNPKLLRIRLLHNNAAVPLAVELQGTGVNLPPQGTLLESTGEFGETKRKIQVYRSYPRLPALFDYVIFAGGIITK